MGEAAFNEWGWRIPFLISFLLVMMAIYIRLPTGGTPIFQEMKAKGNMVTNPWKEAFLSSNIQIRRGRHRGFDRAGRRVVQRSILGALLPADGEKSSTC